MGRGYGLIGTTAMGVTVIGSAAIAAGTAAAAPTVLEASGSVVMFSSSFEGADQAPFAGLEDGQSWSLRLAYDSDTPPVRIVDDRATYMFAPAASFVRLGDQTIAVESASVSVLSDPSAASLFSFSLQAPSAGFRAELSFSPSGPVHLGLPTPAANLSPDSGEFNADSDLNSLLLPVVLGSVESVNVVPAPGLAVIGGLGLLAAARRRR